MNGVDSRTLAAVIGNKTLRMVQRYSHLSNAHLKNSVEQAAPKINLNHTTVSTTPDPCPASENLNSEALENEKSHPTSGRIIDPSSAPSAMQIRNQTTIKSSDEMETKTKKKSRSSMPPTGFEPVISALRGRRPKPLDDEGTNDRQNSSQPIPNLCLERAAS